MRKIVLAVALRQFRGRMAFDGETQFVRRHAAAVILDQDQIGAAAGGGDIDAGSAGIQRVLHQLLHHRGGPLHHFAGGNAVDRAFG